MNNVIKRITVDISNENSFDWLEAVQGDSASRYVYISLLNNGVPYPLNQVVPVIRGEKSDGTTIFNSCQLTENGEIIVELTSQMLSAAGKSVYEVALYGTDMEVLTSFPFYLSVNPANFCPEKIASTDEYTMIADIMKNVNNLYDAVSEATEQAGISAKKAAMSAESARDASESAETAKSAETASADSADTAAANAAQAQSSAAAATASETNAADSETAASISETNAKISENNAKKHLDDMKEIADSFEGTLRPKGEILFENLPPVSTAKAGDMYTVTDHFITTADFTNGAGIEMPQYVSIYKAENGKWTALDGSLITGVKGECEDEYRIGKVVVTKSSIGLENADNTSDTEKPVSTAQQAALDSYYQQSTGYADQKIADLINGAPSTLDTLGEIADAMAENANVVEALEASIGSKASEAEFDSHVKDKSAHITTAERNGWNDPSPVFTQAGTRANIASGEKLSVLMGKIKKFFADLKAVAFSGSYNDLSDKPAIPTVGNGTVTIKQAGTSKGTFTMNQSGDTTIELTDNNTTYTPASAAPKANGTASVGTSVKYAREDHVHPLQTTVSGNAGSATKLATARAIDGMSFNGSAAITHYGTCSTAAATAAKAVTLSGFTLTTGAAVKVKFTVTNTAENPTLNVNGTGAKAIQYRGTAISAGNLAANRVYEFVYDGTAYQFLGDLNTNTTYATATTSKNGLMLAADKAKLDGIAAGAQVNSITGVKGNAESAYRKGNVNITPANIGLGNVDNTADANKSVNYANSAGNADTVDGIHGFQLGTFSGNGTFHGTNHTCYCMHNVFSDNRFAFRVDGFETRVDHATSADSANSVAYSNVSGRPTFSLSGTTLYISF